MAKKSPKSSKKNALGDKVVSTFKRSLPVPIDKKMTEKKMARVVSALGDVKLEREKLNAESLVFKKRIKDFNAEIELLRMQIEKGTEERDVPCEEVRDFKRQRVVTRRQDTAEIIEERAMSPEDRQEDLLPVVSGQSDVNPVDDDDEGDDDAADKAGEIN